MRGIAGRSGRTLAPKALDLDRAQWDLPTLCGCGLRDYPLLS
jgi:hypothetical protein